MWINVKRAFLTIAGFLALPACQGGDTERPGITVSDSSGVEIVLVSRAVSAAAPTLHLSEELRIGAREGPVESQFFTVAGVAEDQNGDLFVLDVGNQAVRVFDHGGEFLREIGGEGGGPGRFERPYALGLGRDSLIVLDRRLIHVFASDGTLLEAHQPSLSGRQAVWTVTGTSEGWIAGIRRPPDRAASPPGGPFVDMIWLARLDPSDGSVASPLNEIPVRTTYQIGPGVVSPLLAATGQYAVSERGEVYSSAGDDYVVEQWNSLGELRRRIRVETPRIAVTDADFDRFMDAELSSRSGQGGGEMRQSLQAFETEFPRLPRPDFRPIVGRILAARERILVERLDLDPDPFEDGDESSWDLLGVDGTPLGRINLEANIRPLLLTDSGFYGVVRDEMDVESVARFRIEF